MTLDMGVPTLFFNGFTVLTGRLARQFSMPTTVMDDGGFVAARNGGTHGNDGAGAGLIRMRRFPTSGTTFSDAIIISGGGAFDLYPQMT
jgi:hypothetical protein